MSSTPVQVLLYCTRLPNLTPIAFRTYIEQIHVPYVQSLLGDLYPVSHMRYYTNKPAGYVVGTPEDAEPDLIAVITYRDEEHLRRSMALRMSEGVRQKIQEDESKFMVLERVKVIRLGDGTGDVGGSEGGQ